MTDWERAAKLRKRGATWAEVAADRRVGFQPPEGSDPARALKTIYLRRHARSEPSSSGGETEGRSLPVRALASRLGSRRGIILFLVILVAVILATYAYESDLSAQGKPTGWVGRVAPDFSLSVANGGGTFHLASERNHTNVLLFFNEGLSCSPCLSQMQQLDWDAAEFRAIHVTIVSITQNSLSDLSTWATNNHVTHTVVLADPSLTVCNEYDTTGAAVSMMPGAAPGHTFILVNETGIVVWRADYGPSDMSVPDSQIYSSVQSALGS